LFDRVKFERADVIKPARAFTDYKQVDAAALKDLPSGVTLIERV